MLSVPIPAAGTRSAVSGLHGSSDALALAELAKHRRLVAVLTSQAQDAQRLSEEIAFFAPELRVHLFPDWETLPYDSFSPHQDLVSERLATLYQISHRACDVVIVPVTTALYRLPRCEFLAAYSFFLKQGAAHRRQRAAPAAHAWPATPTSPRWSRPANTAFAAA